MLRRTPSDSPLSSRESSPVLDRYTETQASPVTLPLHALAARTSNIFELNETGERLQTLQGKLDALMSATKLTGQNDDYSAARDNYFKFLDEARESSYFFELAMALDNGRKLLPGEYIYLTLVAQDLDFVDAEQLRAAQKLFGYQFFDINLDVLFAALECQHAANQQIKHDANAKLKQALASRAKQPAHEKMFLNLSGINLSRADLSETDLSFCELTCARLNEANLHRTRFDYCRLNSADFSRAQSERLTQPAYSDGPHIAHTIAKAANFDKIHAADCDWSNSDFSQSSFISANIERAYFTNTVFNDAQFTGAAIEFSRAKRTENCSFKRANMLQSKIAGADFHQLDFSDAKLLRASSYEDTEKLGEILASLNGGLLDPIRNGNFNEEYFTRELVARKITLANEVIRGVNAAEHLNVEQKIAMLDMAAEHDVFQPEAMLQRAANHADRGIFSFGTLFAGNAPHHAAYATPAMQLLEGARDQLINQLPSPRPGN